MAIANAARPGATPPIVGGESRVQAIDALRGTAILLVLFWHYLPEPWIPVPDRVFGWIRAGNTMSWTGVDLFFVLSGFLIVSNLLAQRGAPHYFKTFYIRRVCRIMPLYVVALAAAALSVDFAASWRQFIPYLVFQQNAVMAAHANWGVTHLEVTWSLAVEEQFYLLAPLVVHWLPAKRLPVALLACACVAPVARCLIWLMLPAAHAPFVAFTLLPCRMDTIAWGGLLAWATRDGQWRAFLNNTRALALVAFVTGAAGLVFPLANGWAWPSEFVSTAGFSIVAVFYAALIALVLRWSPPAFVSGFLIRPLALVGLGAYSIYLFHLTIHQTTYDLVSPRHSLASYFAYGCLLAALNVAVAVLSWRFIESPAIRFGHRYRYS